MTRTVDLPPTSTPLYQALFKLGIDEASKTVLQLPGLPGVDQRASAECVSTEQETEIVLIAEREAAELVLMGLALKRPDVQHALGRAIEVMLLFINDQRSMYEHSRDAVVLEVFADVIKWVLDASSGGNCPRPFVSASRVDFAEHALKSSIEYRVEMKSPFKKQWAIRVFRDR